MPEKAYKIAVVAGEASSDLLAANLIKDLLTLHPRIEVIAVGGDKIRALDQVNVFQDNEVFSIMGLAEVVKDLPRLLKLKNSIVEKIIQFQPDVFIGVDSPDLNFPIGKKLKPKGIKVIHYVSPSVWAWRPKRVNKMAGFIDMVLTLFPFEVDIYQNKHILAEFVGHPLANQIPFDVDKQQAKEKLGLKPDEKVLALLPGSRKREIKNMMPYFAKTIVANTDSLKGWRILSANVSDEKIKLSRQLAEQNGLKLEFVDDASSLLMAADVGMLASGTVALEAMLCKTAMLVSYQISAISYFIVNTFKMMQQPYYSLPNVLHGGFLVPEIMQSELNVKNLSHALNGLIMEKNKDQLIEQFKLIHRSIVSPEKQAGAKKVLDFLGLRC